MYACLHKVTQQSEKINKSVWMVTSHRNKNKGGVNGNKWRRAQSMRHELQQNSTLIPTKGTRVNKVNLSTPKH